MGEITPIDTIQKILNRYDVACYYQYDLYTRVLECCKAKDGLYLEFGLYMGNTAKQICEITKDKLLYGFESFQGLESEVTPENLIGMCKLVGELPEYHRNIRLIIGRVQDSLPLFLDKYKNHIAFANFDMDSKGNKYALFELAKYGRLKSGTVLVICHAFKLYGGKIYDSVYKAFEEFVNTFNVKFEYLGFGDVHLGIRILEDII